jgi:hypothetical protein
VHYTCTTHLILLDLMTLTIFVFREQYKLWSSSLCSFLQPPTISFLFGPNILFSTLFSYNKILYGLKRELEPSVNNVIF